MSLSFSIFEGSCCASCAEHDAAETLVSLSPFDDEYSPQYDGGAGRPLLDETPYQQPYPGPYIPPPVNETPYTQPYPGPYIPPPVNLEILTGQPATINAAAPVPPGKVFTSGPQSPPFNPGVSTPPVPGKQTPLPADDGKEADGTMKILGFEMDPTTILIGGAVAVAAVVLLAGD